MKSKSPEDLFWHGTGVPFTPMVLQAGSGIAIRFGICVPGDREVSSPVLTTRPPEDDESDKGDIDGSPGPVDTDSTEVVLVIPDIMDDDEEMPSCFLWFVP